MRKFPIACSDCGTVYESRDELNRKEKGGTYQYTYHCPECAIKVFGLTLKQGNILDSKIF